MRYDILNLGAGVESSALYMMSIRQEVPHMVPVFDYAVFADTQEETDETYRHLEWLEKESGGPKIIRATYGRLGDDLVIGIGETRRFASIPAFVTNTPGVDEGILPRQCTSDYKVDVVEFVIRREILGLKFRERINPDVRVVQYFGIGYDDPKRLARVQNRFVGRKNFEAQFPLAGFMWGRSDCESYLSECIPHKVTRSACVFCPFKSNAEWQRMKDNDPKSWARAVEIDEALRQPGTAANRDMEKQIYLHRQCVPLTQVDLVNGRGSRGVAESECDGVCDC